MSDERKQGTFDSLRPHYHAIIRSGAPHKFTPARRPGWFIWNGVVVPEDEIRSHCDQVTIYARRCPHMKVVEVDYEEHYERD